MKIQKKTINAFQIGLVFKNGALEQILEQGKHWLFGERECYIFDKTKPFKPTNLPLELLLQNQKLNNLIELIEVKDNEIALQYKNGNLHQVLEAGVYAYWKNVIDYTYETVNLEAGEIDNAISKTVLRNPKVVKFIRVYVVESYEKGLLFIDGKFKKALDAGVYYFWKGEEIPTILKADLRKQQMEISGQELLTKDKAAVRINFYAHYKVANIEKALVENKDYFKQLYLLMQLGLREYIGMHTLDELLANKESATPYVMNFATEKAKTLGVDLETCGIRDIILPGDVKEIMNQVLIAEKKAQANVIMRREETASTRSLLNTAKLMEQNEMLFKLKEMEYVEKISEKIQNISVSGGGQLVEQLKGIFSAK